jgi:PHD/YefM family antitoxin component YafN of YafNO toxin-antitoxin module
MNRASRDRATIPVTRHGSEPVVLLARSEYEGMMETPHLGSSSAHAMRLDEAIAQAGTDDYIEVDPKTLQPI